MVINVDPTKEVYESLDFTSHEHGIVEVEDEYDYLVWDAIDHLIGANPHLIPMSITRETDEEGNAKAVILFVEKSVFGHQNPNIP